MGVNLLVAKEMIAMAISSVIPCTTNRITVLVKMPVISSVAKERMAQVDCCRFSLCGQRIDGHS